MSEKNLNSSINDYNDINNPKCYFKQLEWDMAIGLQEVDNLKPSKYLKQISEKNILGELTIEEVEKSLKDYYVEKSKQNNIDYNELECDFVSMRIVELLEKDDFELSIDYLKYIHKYLFQDVYEFAGEFRNINFSKHEKILNNDSVAYGDYKSLKESLEYDITLEKEKKYKEMSIVDVIKNITDFSFSIWQVHPFREGNTRTIALFIEKYLIKFYENLLLGKNNNLHSEDLIVKESFIDKTRK